MTGPAASYPLNFRRVTASAVSIIENGSPVTINGAYDLNWSFQIDRVPTATFRVRHPVPSYIRYFTDVQFEVAFGQDRPTLAFNGKILNVNPDERGATVECSGLSWPLDVTFHKTILTISNDTSANVVAAIFALAGITRYSIDLPAWTIATTGPITIEFQTYAEALKKVLEVEGAHWYEDPAGGVHVAQLDVIAASTPFTTYFTETPTPGDFPNTTIPDGVSGNARIRNIRRSESVRDVKNQIFIRGATINTQNPTTGETESADIESTTFAPSEFVLYPDGTQAYNDFLMTNELIDTQAKADEVAQRYLFLLNRLQQSTAVDIDGDPSVFLGRTVQIIDEGYSRVTGLFFIEAYQSSLSASGFSTSLTLFGGGTALNVKPVAAFVFRVEREVITDRVYAVVTLDASSSYDPDGEIFSYAWSDNQTPDIATGSDPVYSFRVDPTTIVGTWTVTLQVVDFGGASASISHDVPYAADHPLVTIPGISVAFDNRFSASRDGGQTWGDQVGTGVGATAISPFGMFDPPIVLFGTTAGGIYRSLDYCATAPTQVMANVGSPIAHIWWHTGVQGGVYAITLDGRMYRSTGVPFNDTTKNNGAQWELYENFRTRFNYPQLTLRRIDSSPYGMRVFGGTGAGLGRPFIACELAQGSWNEITTATGDLLLDMNATAPSEFEIAQFQYPGGGSGQFGIGFIPDLIIGYPDNAAGTAYIRCQGWDTSFPVSGGAAVANAFTSISTQTIQVGAALNAGGVTYNIFALRDKQRRIFSGTYAGTGVGHDVVQGPSTVNPYDVRRDEITNPIVAMVFGGTRAAVLTAVMPSNITAPGFLACSEIGAATAFQLDELVRLNSNGFRVHTGTDTNTNGSTYYYVTIPWDRAIVIDRYSGNGADNRNIMNGTFVYGMVFGDTTQQKVHRIALAGSGGDLTHQLVAGGASVADRIQLLNSPAFQVGTNTQVNGVGGTYYPILFGTGQGQTPASDLIVADGAWRRPNELIIILASNTAIGNGHTIYYTPNFLDTIVTGQWRRVYGAHKANGELQGRYICADQEVDKFVAGYNNEFAYTIDMANGLGMSLRAAGQLDAGDDNNHAIWMGQRILGLSGVYLIAGEGAADGTVYKTVDRFATVQKLRPATSFPAVPAGANAKMVAIGPPAKGEKLYVLQSPLGINANYAARVAEFDGAAWSLKSNPAAAAQDPYYCMKRLGANLFRIIGAPDGASFTGRHPGQLQRSTDNGATWGNVGPAPIVSGANQWGVNDIDIATNGVLWLTTCTDNSGGNDAALAGLRIYKSVDDGLNWTQEYEDATKDGGFWRSGINIVCHPNNFNIIAVVAHRFSASTDVYISTNGGTSFTRNPDTGVGPPSNDKYSVMMDNGRIVTFNGGGGPSFYFTDDYGATDWTLVDIISTFIYGIWRVGQYIFASAGTANTPTLYRSADYGVSWQAMLTSVSSAIPNQIRGITYSPASGKMYVATESSGAVGTTLRVLRWDSPFEAPANRDINTLTDLTANLDSLFTDAVDLEETIAQNGITL